MKATDCSTHGDRGCPELGKYPIAQLRQRLCSLKALNELCDARACPWVEILANDMANCGAITCQSANRSPSGFGDMCEKICDTGRRSLESVDKMSMQS